MVRESCDVHADTRIRDGGCFLRATFRVDGGGFAVESSIASPNGRFSRPPFVPQGVFTIAFCVCFLRPFFYAYIFCAGSSSSLEGVSKCVLEVLEVSGSFSFSAFDFASAFLRFSSTSWVFRSASNIDPGFPQ